MFFVYVLTSILPAWSAGMTSLGPRNGYTRLPTADPDFPESTGMYNGVQNGPHRDWDAAQIAQGLNYQAGEHGGGKNKKKGSLNHRPGLFHMFGDRWKYAANHVSVAIASQSESEQEAEKIELTDFRIRRPKPRRGRIKSGSKSPKASKQKHKFKFNTIEEPILPGDTVQRVALRYGCTISEIRRVNNLYQDQDFHALKTVKIPVREHGILTDPNARERCRKNNVEETHHSSGGATSDDLRLGGPGAYYRSDEDEYQQSCDDADDEVGDSDSPEIRDVSIQSALKWKHSQNALLEKFDVELQKVRENTEQRLANLNEVALTMTTPIIQPLPIKKGSYEADLLRMNYDWRVVTIVGVAICLAIIFSIIVYVVLRRQN